MAPASRYRRPSRRGALVAAAAVVVLSVLVAFALRPDGDGGDDKSDRDRSERQLERFGSDEVDESGPIEIGEEPAAYRITYRVAQRGSGAETEELTVLRPFWSEVLTRGAGGEVLVRQRWSFGRVHTHDGPVFAVGPVPPGSDLRVAPVLEEALDAGLLVRGEQREVAGRRCQVYRASASVVGGTLHPFAEDGEEHADVCVDAAGLVLEEWWVVSGDALRQRVATSVEESVPAGFASDWADAAPTLATDDGGGSILPVTDDSAPPGAPFFSAPAPPAGFSHVGRYSVIPPQAEAFDEELQQGSELVASTADVWRRGIDVVVLDQGGTLGGVEIYDPAPGNRLVDVRGLGVAEIVVSLTGSEIRVQRPLGKYVRVIGTLPPDDLLAFARTLVEGVGSELVVDEDAPLPRP